MKEGTIRNTKAGGKGQKAADRESFGIVAIKASGYFNACPSCFCVSWLSGEILPEVLLPCSHRLYAVTHITKIILNMRIIRFKRRQVKHRAVGDLTVAVAEAEFQVVNRSVTRVPERPGSPLSAG